MPQEDCQVWVGSSILAAARQLFLLEVVVACGPLTPGPSPGGERGARRTARCWTKWSSRFSDSFCRRTSGRRGPAKQPRRRQQQATCSVQNIAGNRDQSAIAGQNSSTAVIDQTAIAPFPREGVRGEGYGPANQHTKNRWYAEHSAAARGIFTLPGKTPSDRPVPPGGGKGGVEEEHAISEAQLGVEHPFIVHLGDLDDLRAEGVPAGQAELSGRSRV